MNPSQRPSLFMFRVIACLCRGLQAELGPAAVWQARKLSAQPATVHETVQKGVCGLEGGVHVKWCKKVHVAEKGGGPESNNNRRVGGLFFSSNMM